MATIYQLPIPQPVSVGVFPNLKFALFGDNLTAITTAGYLNSVNLESNPIASTDVLQVLYNYNPVSQQGSFGIFTISITNGVITLNEWANPGDVLLPVGANRAAQFNGTTGQIYDGTAPLTHRGNIVAGLPTGTSGAFVSYSGTGSTGALIVQGVANTGNTNTTISNSQMGQASVINIPDPGVATADFAVAPSALVNGNLIKAQGTTGLIADTGMTAANVMLTNAINNMSGAGRVIPTKGNGTEAGNVVNTVGIAGTITTSSLTTAGGSNYVITMNNAQILTTSQIIVTLISGTNTATYNITLTCNPNVSVGGSAEILIFNNTAATALNGNIQIAYMIV